MFFKYVFKIFATFIIEYLCWSLFLIKLQAWKPLLKRDFIPGVFLRILRNFWEQLFYRKLMVAASEKNCPESSNEFLDCYFFNLPNRTSGKSNRPVFVNMNLVFLSAVCADSLAFYSSICHVYVTNLIELRMGKLILNHFFRNNCPEFRNGLLNSYFFRKWLFGTLLVESRFQNHLNTVIPVTFTPELQTHFDAYTVFKINP